jgi:hypothetical protein
MLRASDECGLRYSFGVPSVACERDDCSYARMRRRTSSGIDEVVCVTVARIPSAKQSSAGNDCFVLE